MNYLRDQDIHVPYAYRLRYQNGLAHSFINTLLFLDPDRRGFDYPVLPIHINCYGGDLIRQRGGARAPSDVDEEPDPSAPSAAASNESAKRTLACTALIWPTPPSG